jgi:hypothetical protein
VERHDVVAYVIPEAVDAGAYAPLPLSELNVGEFLDVVLPRRVLSISSKNFDEVVEHVGHGEILFREALHAAVERGRRKDAEDDHVLGALTGGRLPPLPSQL